MKHSGQVEILDDSGMPVRHTPNLSAICFNEELDRLLPETAKNSEFANGSTLREARGSVKR